MKLIRILIMNLGLIALVGACLKQPEYSINPEISFNDLYFKAGSLINHIQDTLVIKFDFKDGDGDLGLTSDELSTVDFSTPWYYLYDVNNYQIYYTNDRITPLTDGYKWVNYASRNVPQLSSLDFPPINCTNWEQIKGDGTSGVTDTLYITQNDKALNIFVELAEKNFATGEYELFDPTTYFAFPGCSPNYLNGTFKNLASDPGRSAPIEGTFKYSIAAFGLDQQFSGQTLRLRVHILDKASHQSNILEKKDFTLSSIKRP